MGQQATGTEFPVMAARHWREVLGVDEVGADDDFFALGGSSIQAMRFGRQLAAASGHRIPILWVFQHSRFGDFVTHAQRELYGLS